MRSVREGVLPPVPQSVEEIDERLQQLESIQGFYRGCARAEDGGMGFVFICPGMEGPLSRRKKLFEDGTFKVKPKFFTKCYMVSTFFSMLINSSLSATKLNRINT